MFKINYRLITDLNNLKRLTSSQFDYDVEGFFELKINENSYGRFHEKPLGEFEEGDELLITWFSSLLAVGIELNTGNYALLKVIEAYKLWVEFKRQDDEILVSLVNKETLTFSFTISYVTTEQFNEFEYDDWYNQKITYSELCLEIVNKSKKFYNELLQINYNLKESGKLKSFKRLIDDLEVISLNLAE